jgi:hypothetical protein
MPTWWDLNWPHAAATTAGRRRQPMAKMAKAGGGMQRAELLSTRLGSQRIQELRIQRSQGAGLVPADAQRLGACRISSAQSLVERKTTSA